MKTPNTMRDFAIYGTYAAEMMYQEEKRHRAASSPLRVSRLRDRIGNWLIELGLKLEGKQVPRVSQPKASFL